MEAIALASGVLTVELVKFKFYYDNVLLVACMKSWYKTPVQAQITVNASFIIFLFFFKFFPQHFSQIFKGIFEKKCKQFIFLYTAFRRCSLGISSLMQVAVMWNSWSLAMHFGDRMWNVLCWATIKGTALANSVLWPCRMADSLAWGKSREKRRKMGLQYSWSKIFFIMSSKLLIVHMLPEWSQRHLQREMRASCCLNRWESPSSINYKLKGLGHIYVVSYRQS